MCLVAYKLFLTFTFSFFSFSTHWKANQDLHIIHLRLLHTLLGCTTNGFLSHASLICPLFQLHSLRLVSPKKRIIINNVSIMILPLFQKGCTKTLLGSLRAHWLQTIKIVGSCSWCSQIEQIRITVSTKCRMQTTADHCFQHANEDVTTIVSLFSNPENNRLQSAFCTVKLE